MRVSAKGLLLVLSLTAGVASAEQTRWYSDAQIAQGKQLFQENKAFNMSINHMIRNIVMISLAQNNLEMDALVKFTGVKEDQLKPFLDKMVEEKKIEEKEGKYSIVKNG